MLNSSCPSTPRAPAPSFSLYSLVIYHHLVRCNGFVMKMERDSQSNFGSFNDTTFSHNHELTPLPPSDFTPFQQLPSSSAAFNYPLPTHLFDFFPKPQHQLHHLPEPKRPRLDWHPPQQSRQRTKLKLSDKTRSLQKLLPSDKKMDIATMLEEAHKYVRFLQAQVRAIQSMPLQSSFVVQNDSDLLSFGGPTGLGILNRQQLLQVLLNSPAAQTMLYSQGFCVYSLEQLLFLNKLSQPNLFIDN